MPDPPLLLILIFTLSTLLVLLIILVTNLHVLPRLSNYAPLTAKPAPTVAILVPARNEEANIEPCLLSLLKQNYPDYSVWLYDDRSTDRTPEIAARLAVQHPHLHVITASEEPPPGWLGKAHALHSLYRAVSEQLSPSYLLFTDADVVFQPSALAHSIAAAENGLTSTSSNNTPVPLGLLSIFPRQITLSWAERLAVPMFLHWAVYTFLPLPLAFTHRTGPLFAAANGQFMLFRHEAYIACGGHESVRGEILEDVALARVVKGAGYRSLLADGGPLVTTRMYKGAGEVWRGYSKNAYSFFNYSPFFAGIGVSVLLALYIAPLFLSAYALFTSQPFLLYLSLAHYILGILPRILLALRFKYRLWDSFLHPLSVLFQIVILLNSAWWAHSGRGAWKGRGAKVAPRQTPIPPD